MTPLPAPSPFRVLPAALAVLALAFGLAACGDNSTPSMPQVPAAPTPAPTTPTTPTPTPEQPAETTYDITWTSVGPDLDPEEFPAYATNSLLVAEHPANVVIWKEGFLASDGLKLLAESEDGDTTVLIKEATDKGANVLYRNADLFIEEMLGETSSEEGGMSSGGGGAITLSYTNPCVTYANAINPSPDWFQGFHDACAVDGRGMWKEEFRVSVNGWDAGTDDGDDYNSEDAPRSRRAPIRRLDKWPYNVGRYHFSLTFTRR